MTNDMGMRESVKMDLGEILKPIEPYLKKVDEEIRTQLNTGIPLLDKSASHLFEGGGKKIRASLIILTSGLKAAPDDSAIRMAAAAEIVHCASLIHDDIIDQSIIRRGLPTVSKVWGHRVAVLSGDYMYTKALGISVGEKKTGIYPVLVNATSDMVKGELYQLEFSNIDKINKDHYFRIIELKTARFMAACMKLGAVLGSMTDEECDILYDAGLNLGYAFQIVDDTLDVIDNHERTGKMSGNDFFEGKITLPFLNLVESVDDEERKQLNEFSKNPDGPKWDIVKRRIHETGSVKYCLEIADGFNRKVLEHLDLIPASAFKDIILELSKFLVERNY